MQPDRNIPLPFYRKVKNHIIDQVQRGRLKHDVRLPSQTELVERFGISRMTVHRALRKLSAEGVVDCVQGLGTFVSGQTELMEPKDTAKDIKARGNIHTQKIRLLKTIDSAAKQCTNFELMRGVRLFHSIIVNHEDGTHIQVKNRLVRPNSAPSDLDHNFQFGPLRLVICVRSPTQQNWSIQFARRWSAARHASSGVEPARKHDNPVVSDLGGRHGGDPQYFHLAPRQVQPRHQLANDGMADPCRRITRGRNLYLQSMQAPIDACHPSNELARRTHGQAPEEILSQYAG